ncbi:hypothetical protein ACWCOV_29875 [Kribbella sp. NPDC002412]
MIPETRGSLELGLSHRLLYREFEATDGGLPYREVVAFEPRKNDRPFEVAAARLGRRRGIRIQRLEAVVARIQRLEAVVATRASAPIRQPLPSDLRQALATAIAGVPPSGPAALRPPTAQRHTGPRRGAPPNREL